MPFAIAENPFVGIGAGIAITVSAALMRWAFLGELGARAPFITFYPAVALAALLAGFPAGAVATTLSALLVSFFWMPPIGSTLAADRLALAIFVFSGMIVSWTAELSKRATHRAKRTEAGRREEIERVVLKRTVQLAETTQALQAEMSERHGLEERFRQVIEAAPTAMLLIDGKGAIELANAQAEQVFGYGRGDLLGRRIDELLPERFRAAHAEDRAAFASAPARRAMGIGRDLFGLRRDGVEFPVEVALGPMKTHEGVKVISSIVDVSARKEVERALSESEERMRLMFDAIQDHAIFMLDAEGRVVSWNSGAERVKGYSKDEILGRHFALFHLPEDVADGNPERELRIAASAGSVEDEGWRLRKDGSRFLASATVNAVRGPEGDLRGFVKVVRDITARKRMENQLVEVNERFALAAEAAGIGVWDFDIAARSLHWDEQMFKLYGLDPRDGLQPYEIWAAAVHPDDRERTEREARQAIEGVREYQTEFRVVRPDGEMRYVRSAASLSRNPDGTAARLVGLNIDITDRKRVEIALLESNERFAVAADAAGLGFWDYDIATQSVEWDDQMFRIRGDIAVKRNQYPHRLDYVHAEDRPRVDQRLREAAAGLNKFDCEYRIVLADGQIKHIKSAANLKGDPVAGTARLLGVSFDITERKRIENELVDANEHFALAAEAAGLGFWDYDFETQTSRWDSRMRELYGLTGKDEDRHPIRLNHVLAEDRARVDEALRHAVDGLRSFEAEYRILRADGRVSHIRSAASTKCNLAGQATQLLGVSFDVTDRKEALEALEQARDAAEAANRAKSDFLAVISHEIRTPMNGIIGMNALLLETELEPKQRSMLQTVRDSADSLLTIIDDILDFSKLESGKIDLEEDDFELPALIGRIMELFAPRAEKKGLALSADTSAVSRPALRGDASRLRQILLNLVSNAIKFTPSGSVMVAATTTAVARSRARVRCEVRDTGLGVDQKAKARLFQPFQQADGSIRRRFGGTGLGLSICKRLVERMGGKIGVSDRVGGGSTFWFELDLPAAQTAKTLTAPRPAEPIARPLVGATGRILLAEDNAMNRELATTILRQAGYVVDVVFDGDAAVSAFRRSRYDLILMDMRMPDKDGLAATAEIRALERDGRRVPIVAMTANAMKEDQRRCLEAGMDDHFSKPFQPGRLIEKVDRWIRQSRLQPSAAAQPSGTGYDAFPVIDVQAGELLLSCFPRKKFLVLLRRFLRELDKDRDSFPRLARLPALTELGREAHQLIAVAGQFGATQVQKLAADLQSACEAGDETSVTYLLERFGPLSAATAAAFLETYSLPTRH
jgi:PAS domain S-box-containing protein